jgi:hypothetical protein
LFYRYRVFPADIGQSIHSFSIEDAERVPLGTGRAPARRTYTRGGVEMGESIDPVDLVRLVVLLAPRHPAFPALDDREGRGRPSFDDSL